MFLSMREMIPLYEGFLTYGGMSVREMEAMAIGLQESLDIDIISQTPIFVKVLCDELCAKNIPVVTPAGGLGCHVDARQFCAHLSQELYPAGALAAAFYLISGVRGMERGTLSEQRNPDGSETLAHMELLRLAFPKRVFTLSQVKYVADRLTWLYENRELIGGLTFEEEPRVLRFFFGRLQPIGNWPDTLVKKFRADFGDSL
jgi:tryptophanase